MAHSSKAPSVPAVTPSHSKRAVSADFTGCWRSSGPGSERHGMIGRATGLQIFVSSGCDARTQPCCAICRRRVVGFNSHRDLIILGDKIKIELTGPPPICGTVVAKDPSTPRICQAEGNQSNLCWVSRVAKTYRPRLPVGRQQGVLLFSPGKPSNIRHLSMRFSSRSG